MSYFYRLALAHQDELLRQAAERKRPPQSSRMPKAPAARDAHRAAFRLRALRRSASQA